MRHFPCCFWIVALAMFAGIILPGPTPVWADGMVMAPAKRDYKGSLEERAQEAIIIFNSSPPKGEAIEGRQRGNLTDVLFHPTGVVMLPDGRHLAAGGGAFLGAGGEIHVGSVIRFWDLAAALKQIRAFEDSLAGPKAGK